jgi:hypothetical protein
VHGVASSSKIRRLTNGCASDTTSGYLGFLKTYLVAVGTTRLLFLCCGGVQSHDHDAVSEPKASCALQSHD